MVVTRVTDRQELGSLGVRADKHAYAKNQPWNADASLIRLDNRSPALLIDSRTLGVVGIRRLPSQCVWSASHPNLVFGVSTAEAVWLEQDVREPKPRVCRRFDGFDGIDFGGGEGNMSMDDTRVLLLGRGIGGATLLLHDRQYDSLVAQRRLDIDSAGPGGELDNWTVSPSGRFAVLQFARGPRMGLEVCDSLLRTVRRVTEPGRDGGHFDVGLDAAGREVVVWQAGDRSLRMAWLDSGENTRLLAPERLHWGLHISCRSTNWPGWALVSSFAYANRPPAEWDSAESKPIHGSILAVALDGSERVRSFGRSYHASRIKDREYDRAPMAVARPDGDAVLFASDWGDSSPDAPVEVYVAQPITAGFGLPKARLRAASA